MRTVEMEAIAVDEADDPTAPVLSSGAPRRPLVWWQTLGWVALGGAVGSVLRYLVGVWLPTITTPTLVEFPRGMLLSNCLGCLGLGVLYGFLDRRPDAPGWVRPFLGIGLLGSFASFSYLILVGSATVGADFPVMALVYGAVTLVCALGGIVIGFLVGQILGPTAQALRALRERRGQDTRRERDAQDDRDAQDTRRDRDAQQEQGEQS
jgi:CrcB protein